MEESSTRVLIVEDNEDSRDMLTRRLQRKGFDVSVAVDGAQGLSSARTESPDIIIMDLDLPEIDGWEVTRRLKAAPETAKIPIIALTAHAMEPDRNRALDAGCDEYATKPVDYKNLLEIIRRLLT